MNQITGSMYWIFELSYRFTISLSRILGSSHRNVGSL